MLHPVVRKSKISMQINGFPLCCPKLNTGIVNHQTKQTQNFLPAYIYYGNTDMNFQGPTAKIKKILFCLSDHFTNRVLDKTRGNQIK